jgi:hypothetical protein
VQLLTWRLTHKKRKVNGPVGDGASWNHRRFRTGGVTEGFPKAPQSQFCHFTNQAMKKEGKGRVVTEMETTSPWSYRGKCSSHFGTPSTYPEPTKMAVSLTIRASISMINRDAIRRSMTRQETEQKSVWSWLLDTTTHGRLALIDYLSNQFVREQMESARQSHVVPADQKNNKQGIRSRLRRGCFFDYYSPGQ